MPQPAIEQIGPAGRHPIVFLGGWAMTTDTYRARLTALAEHFTVYAITLPGFGDNAALPVSRSTIVEHATVIDRAIRRLHLPGPYTLLGHSTGAGIATHLAVRHPDRVSELILITPVGNPDPVLRGLLRTLRKLPVPVPADSAPVTISLPLDRRLPANLRLGIDAKRVNLHGQIAVAATHLPVHLILAKDDTLTPPGDLMTTPGAHIHPVTGGHAWFASKPDDCHQLLLEILAPHLHTPATATIAAPASRIARLRTWLSGLPARARLAGTASR